MPITALSQRLPTLRPTTGGRTGYDVDLGHIFVGSASSFSELVEVIDELQVDGVLVDIDLADGRTGPDAAAWLHERGIPALFVTGQELIAAEFPSTALALVKKPVLVPDLAEKLELFRSREIP